MLPNKYLTPKDYRTIVGALKTSFSRSEHAKKIRDNFVSDIKGPKGGRRYRCVICGKDFCLASTNIDHIKPVVKPGTTFYDYTLNELIDRLWCEPDNLQLICEVCHKAKSKAEAAERKRLRHAA